MIEGDVLAIQTGSPYGLAIKAAQWLAGWEQWRVDHVALVTRTDNDGNVWITESSVWRGGDGVRTVPLTYRAYRVIPSGLSGIGLERALAEAKSWGGKPYGFFDVAAEGFVIFDKRPAWVEWVCRRDSSIICSQFVAKCLAAGGKFPWGHWFWVLPAQIAADVVHRRGVHMSTHLKAQLFRAARLFVGAFGPGLLTYLAGGNAVTVAGVGAACVSAVEVVLRAYRPTTPVAK
jgi:hypothetical protein